MNFFETERCFVMYIYERTEGWANTLLYCSGNNDTRAHDTFLCENCLLSGVEHL